MLQCQSMGYLKTRLARTLKMMARQFRLAATALSRRTASCWVSMAHPWVASRHQFLAVLHLAATLLRLSVASRHQFLAATLLRLQAHRMVMTVRRFRHRLLRLRRSQSRSQSLCLHRRLRRLHHRSLRQIHFGVLSVTSHTNGGHSTSRGCQLEAADHTVRGRGCADITSWTQ